MDGSRFAQNEAVAIRESTADDRNPMARGFPSRMLPVFVIGVALAILQQVTGINVFLYYAPTIFERLGTGVNGALLAQVAVGVVMLVFTVVAIWTVDHLGRKPLMIAGAAGMGAFLLAMGVAMQVQVATATLPIILILGYIACFALSVGPVTWVILTEIFPTSIRGRALSIATFGLWAANYVVSQTFPMMRDDPVLIERFHHGFPFYIYGAFCVVLVLVVWFGVPETKGKSLEEIEAFWSRGVRPAPAVLP